MSKPKFKIGDKVRVLSNGKQLKNYHGGWDFGMKSCIGKEYTITKVVEPVGGRYPFYGYIFNGSCWIFDERNLELVKEKGENPANIIFKFKKNKIIAKREGGLKATASCHPDDTYDITIGMKLAFIRLLEKERQEKERAITPIEGFYMCTRSDNQFSSGNIYKFKDGFVRCDCGILCGPYKETQKHNKTVYIDKAIFEEIKWEYA
jgi:hypothetical protein